MNTVEKIKAELKAQKIPVYKMERDLGFSNGYLGQLKKGTMPVGRLHQYTLIQTKCMTIAFGLPAICLPI